MKVTPKFAVIMEGGIVQGVISTDPALVGADFLVIDYDTEGGSTDEVTPVPQGDDETQDAFISVLVVGRPFAEIDLDALAPVDAPEGDA